MRVVLLAKGVGSLVAAGRVRYSDVVSLHIWESDDTTAFIQESVRKTIGGEIVTCNLMFNKILTLSRFAAQALVGVQFAEIRGFDAVVVGWSSLQVRYGALLNLNHMLASFGSRIEVFAPLLTVTESELQSMSEKMRSNIG